MDLGDESNALLKDSKSQLYSVEEVKELRESTMNTWQDRWDRSTMVAIHWCLFGRKMFAYKLPVAKGVFSAMVAILWCLFLRSKSNCV